MHSYERMAKTKYFTLGCNKLLMGVDHKGLLNSKALETIDNPRQRRRRLAGSSTLCMCRTDTTVALTLSAQQQIKGTETDSGT